MSFSQLPAVEKDTEKWAAGKFLGPSYFEATLNTYLIISASLTTNQKCRPSFLVALPYAQVR